MIQLKDFIKSHDNFAIICHMSPDGDTLGSGLAMYHGLVQLGKICNIYCKDTPEALYGMLDGVENIRPVDKIHESNLIFCDCSDEIRASFNNDLSKYNIVNIDHHVSNTMFGDVNIVNNTASATCEVMYDVFYHLGITINEAIARCLYVGICTDTNNFTNSNVSSNTFRVMSEICKLEFGMTDIVRALFKTKSFNKTKAIEKVISNIRMFAGGKFCLTYLTYEDLQNLQVDNTEGLVDVGVNIEGVSVCAFLKGNEDGNYKISLRSNFEVDVRRICEVFGGGGHVKAAGCLVDGDLEHAITTISNEAIKWME